MVFSSVIFLFTVPLGSDFLDRIAHGGATSDFRHWSGRIEGKCSIFLLLVSTR